MRYATWLFVCLLVVLHQDYWQWNDASLVGGLLPSALAYHAGLSILAAVVWWLVTRYSWHEELEVDTVEEPRA
jgi:hypothetical protein